MPSPGWRSLRVLLVVLACGCGGDDAPDVFADLTGTIYFLRFDTFGELRALNPRTGEVRPVAGALPQNTHVAADRAGTFLIVGYGDLYRLDLATAELTPLLADIFTTDNAAVSPSASRVAYQRSLPEGQILAQRPVSGGPEVLLTGPNLSPDYQVTWLDEHRLLFLRPDSTEVRRIWSVNADGTDAKALGGNAGITGGIGGVAVAPTTRRLALLVFDGEATAIWDTDHEAALVRRVASFSGVGAGLAWSPDEAYMVFCLPESNGPADIAVVHRETGQVKRFPGPGDECDPVWTER